MPKPNYHLTRRLKVMVALIWIVLMLGGVVSSILTVQWWQLATGQNLLHFAAWLMALTVALTVLGIWSVTHLIQRITRPIEQLTTAVEDGATSSEIDELCDNPQVETHLIARGFRTQLAQLEAHEETLRRFQAVQTALVQLMTMMRQPILGAPQQEKVILEIVAAMQQRFGYPHVSIYQFDSGNQTLRCLATATNQNQVDDHLTDDSLSLNAAREVIVQTIHTGQLSHAQPALSVDAAAPMEHHEACQPIVVGEKIVGSVYVQYPDNFPFAASNELILSLVSQQLSHFLLPPSTSSDNDIQEQAEQQQLIAEIGDKLRQAPDMDTLMRITVNELSRTLKPARTFIKLDSSVKGSPTVNRGVQNTSKEVCVYKCFTVTPTK